MLVNLLCIHMTDLKQVPLVVYYATNITSVTCLYVKLIHLIHSQINTISVPKSTLNITPQPGKKYLKSKLKVKRMQ